MIASLNHEQEVCLQLQPALLWGLGPAVLGPSPPSTPGSRAPPSALRPLAGHSAVIRSPIPIPSLFLALSLCRGRAGTSCQRIPGSSLAWESGASRGRSPNRAGLRHKAPHSGSCSPFRYLSGIPGTQGLILPVFGTAGTNVRCQQLNLFQSAQAKGEVHIQA